MRPAVLLVMLVALAGCGGGEEASPTVPTVAARTAPAIEGRTLDGGTLSLASLRGKPVVVNVWSSW